MSKQLLSCCFQVDVLDLLDDLLDDVSDPMSYDHPEVMSVETWRSLLLISTKKGIFLRDLDNNNVTYPLSSQTVQK